MIFGQRPPAPADDPALAHRCLGGCAVSRADAGSDACFRLPAADTLEAL
jgi:hypothetical protein